MRLLCCGARQRSKTYRRAIEEFGAFVYVLVSVIRSSTEFCSVFGASCLNSHLALRLQVLFCSSNEAEQRGDTYEAT